MIAHFVEHEAGQAAPAVLRYGGPFGVAIFFVISGFVIHHATADRPIDPLGFALRRVARVVPLYWATTLLVAGIAAIAPQLYRTTTIDTGALVRSLLFIPYDQPAGSGDWRPLFKLGWTLNYEMAFYAGMLAVGWLARRWQRAAALTLLAGALLLRARFPIDAGNPLAFYASHHLLLFVAGLWIADLWRAGVLVRGGTPLAIAAVLPAAMLTIAYYRSDAGPSLMIAASVAVLVAALCLERFVAREIRPVAWIGDISYSLYLLHMFVVGAAWAIAHRLAPGPIGGVGAVIVVVVGSAATLILSHASFRWFETPINRAGASVARRIEQRRRRS